MIVEKRADGRVETEATIKLWVDGERYVFTAEGNGPVNALDKALRGALARVYPELDTIKLVNFKVRILDEAKASDAITRVLLDSSDGEHEWGAIGVSTNVIEASWEALVDSLEHGMQAGRRPAPRTGARAVDRRRHVRRHWAGRSDPDPDPAGATRARRAGGAARCSRCCARASCRSGRAGRSSSARFAARVGARFGSAVSSGTAGLHLALRAVDVTDGDEVITTPFSFVASANVAVYERARPVFVDIDPRHAQLRR